MRNPKHWYWKHITHIRSLPYRVYRSELSDETLYAEVSDGSISTNNTKDDLLNNPKSPVGYATLAHAAQPAGTGMQCARHCEEAESSKGLQGAGVATRGIDTY